MKKLFRQVKFVDANTEDIISKLAQDEVGKRQYYRPIYSIHKWWARRPGSLFRSIILRSSNQNDSLFEYDKNGKFRESKYFQSHELKNLIVLDPFMGGGTTLVEANRLGIKTIGCDINPVSYWIVRETLKSVDTNELKKSFSFLEKTAGEEIKSLYKTNCNICNSKNADGLYNFWLRYVHCSGCNKEVYLFKHTFLNKGLRRNKGISITNPATVFCPHCFRLNDWGGTEQCKCQHCNNTFDPNFETYDNGYYQCDNCGNKNISLIKTLQGGQKLKERLIAIEFNCSSCNKRFYKSPDNEDFLKINKLKVEFEKQRENLIFPKQQLLKGDSSTRWLRHNYKYYYEIFNERQLFSFNILINAIKMLPNKEHQNSFFTIFSNSLEYNNMMTPYNYPHRKLHHLFNYHALPLTTTPVENAVWGVGREGAGTFSNCFFRYLKAKEYAQKPFDKYRNSNDSVHTIYSRNEKIEANFVDDFEKLKETKRGSILLNGDSANLSVIPNKSVDLVITDPPYFDSIHYSELSNFFYVWLRQAVSHPYFKSKSVSIEKEAIVNKKMAKGAAEYTELLKSVFLECGRVLKDDGLLIFTYHSIRIPAWWSVLSSIKESGFILDDYFPVLSEYKVNPHIRGKKSLNMDLVLICKKWEKSMKPITSNAQDILQLTIKNISDKADYNKIFLHFMGELLKSASLLMYTQKIDFNWFNDVLDLFDDYMSSQNLKRMITNNDIITSNQTELFD